MPYTGLPNDFVSVRAFMMAVNEMHHQDWHLYWNFIGFLLINFNEFNWHEYFILKIYIG